MNEQQQQQNKMEDLLIEEKALKHYAEHLKRNILGVPYMKESQAGKDLIKESLEIMLKRTESLRQTKTQQILHYENIPG